MLRTVDRNKRLDKLKLSDQLFNHLGQPVSILSLGPVAVGQPLLTIVTKDFEYSKGRSVKAEGKLEISLTKDHIVSFTTSGVPAAHCAESGGTGTKRQVSWYCRCRLALPLASPGVKFNNPVLEGFWKQIEQKKLECDCEAAKIQSLLVSNIRTADSLRNTLNSPQGQKMDPLLVAAGGVLETTAGQLRDSPHLKRIKDNRNRRLKLYRSPPPNHPAASPASILIILNNYLPRSLPTTLILLQPPQTHFLKTR
jgi:hypothetical protein